MVSFDVPSSVGTSSSVPSVACTMLTGSSSRMSFSCRWNSGCGVTCSTTNRLPIGPPRRPARPRLPAGCASHHPRPRECSRPACVTWTRRCPRQLVHGVVAISRSPLQRGQVLTLTNWPRMVCCAAHFARAVALRAADGLGARLRAGTLAHGTDFLPRDLDFLLRAEDGLLEGDLQVIAQVCAARRAAAAPRIPPMPPKNSSKMSPKPGNPP